MHIGGSHVQAGTWTNGFCQALRSRLPGLSVARGLVFPYRMIGTTQPSDYEVSFGGTWRKHKKAEASSDPSLGLMGIAAQTQDSSAFVKMSVWGEGGALLQFQTVRIFHTESSAAYRFIFPLDPYAVQTRDSLGGFTQIEFSRPLDTLFLQLVETDTLQKSFFLQGIRLEPWNSGVCFDAIGNNGADIPSYLKCDLFTQQLFTVKPDLVILSVGINDAYTRNFNVEQYKQNYRTLIERIRTAAPDCAVLFTTNNDSYYRRRYYNTNGEKVQQALIELAAEYHCGVWDLYEVMGGARSINQWVSARLAQSDKVHFTRAGYQLLGILLSDALVNGYMDYITQSARRD
jgi:lysophospholipase L1-like esterase